MEESKNNQDWGNTDYPGKGSTERLEQLVSKLIIAEERPEALLELSKTRLYYKDLAPVLWYSFGTIAALLQEIVSIYPYLSPPKLTAPVSNHVCNTLALFQAMARHPETHKLLLDAQIPLFLYPFLNTVAKTEPFEFLRLTSLSVIGALVKVDDLAVVNFLLQTEIIPLCLRIMEIGDEFSKTVATFIVYKILAADQGLHYICATADRFYAISKVLSTMVTDTPEEDLTSRMLKHIYRCFIRLCDNYRARAALQTLTPTELKDDTFFELMKEEPQLLDLRNQLLACLSDKPATEITNQVNPSQITGPSSPYSLISSTNPANLSNIASQNYQQILRHNNNQ